MTGEQNIQIVQQMYADFARGDLLAVLAAMADDIQWITPGNSELAGERQGKEEVAAFFRALAEQFEFLAFEPAEYIVSGDRVVAMGRYEVRSKLTRKIAASHWAMVWSIREGKAIRFQEYTDTSSLEAAAASG